MRSEKASTSCDSFTSINQSIGKNGESLLSFSVDSRVIRTSAISSVIVQLLFRLKGIITTPIFTHYLAPSDMGVYNLIMVTASLLTPVFYANLADGPAVFLVTEKSNAKIRSMYQTVVTSSLLLFCLSSAVYLCMLTLFSRESTFLYLVIPVIFANIFYKLLSYVFAVFQKTQQLVKNALLKDGTAVVISVMLVIYGYAYKGLIYGHIISSLVAGFFLFKISRQSLPIRFLIERDVLVKFLRMSIPLLPVFFFSWFIQSADSYFLFHYAGESVVGKYAVVYSLCSVVLILTWTLNFFWFPVSARLWDEDRHRYTDIFRSIFAIFLSVLVVGVVIIELNSGIVMRLLVRRSEYHDAYIIMGLIAAAFSMQVLITLLTAPLYANHNVKEIFLSYLFGSITNCVLNLLLIPDLGILGASISTIVSYVLVMVLMCYFNYRGAGVRLDYRRYALFSVGFALAWILAACAREMAGSILLLANVLLLLVAIPFEYKFFLNNNERTLIKRMIGSLKEVRP